MIEDSWLLIFRTTKINVNLRLGFSYSCS